jgi:hypothetical protein
MIRASRHDTPARHEVTPRQERHLEVAELIANAMAVLLGLMLAWWFCVRFLKGGL